MTVQNIIYIRHAHAGKRDSWLFDDYKRPLSAKGNIQANRFAAKFKKVNDVAPIMIFSSPRLRCITTVGVLSLNTSQQINELSDLDEGSDFKKSLKFALRQNCKTVVLSTHGDIMYNLSKYLVKNKLSKVKSFEIEKSGYWWLSIENGKIKSAKRYKS